MRIHHKIDTVTKNSKGYLSSVFFVFLCFVVNLSFNLKNDDCVPRYGEG
jgi:hypothetical protein